MMDRDPEPMLAWGRNRFMHQSRSRMKKLGIGPRPENNS
jgi:hypothetical protein